MSQANRLLVRNLNSGELAAVKIPPPPLSIASFDVLIPVTGLNIYAGSRSEHSLLQIYDSAGNCVRPDVIVQSSSINLGFQTEFTGLVNILYKPDLRPTITYIIPEIRSTELYYGKLYALGGTPPYTFSIVSGNLPIGIELNSVTGDIAGISSFEQTDQINIICKVTDFYGNSTETSLVISLVGSGIYGRITKAGNLRITKAGNTRITKLQ